MTTLLPKNSTARCAIGLALLFLTTLCPISRADGSHKLVVGKPNTPCPDAQYSTIGAAVSAASPGDEIDICPALYPEQLIITKPLKLVGVTENGVDRVLLQPTLTTLAGLPFEAVITVMSTHDVVIRNLSIDANNNSIAGCAKNTNGVITGSLAGIHFYNASGSVEHSAIFGAQLPAPGCAALFPGNGFAVEVDTDGTSAGPFHVSIDGNSIHDFGRNGILAVGGGVRLQADRNAISGVGPSTGG